MTVYLADYHIHSKYSFDGKESLADICEKAVEQGLSEIAVTDHMDIYSGLPYGTMPDLDVIEGQGGDDIYHGRHCRMFMMDMPGFWRDISEVRAQYEGKIKVKVGTELGQPFMNPAAAADFMKDYGDKLDFVIGSVHNMEDDLDVYYYDFSGIDVNDLYGRYVDRLITLASESDFDVVGHLTYPLRYAYERTGKIPDLSLYKERFCELFHILVQRGKGIEVNVSGLYQPMKETMPPLYLLKLYRECGGEIITVGSDAHELRYIGAYQNEARELIREAGFEYITVFTKRKPYFIPLD